MQQYESFESAVDRYEIEYSTVPNGYKSTRVLSRYAVQQMRDKGLISRLSDSRFTAIAEEIEAVLDGMSRADSDDNTED